MAPFIVHVFMPSALIGTWSLLAWVVACDPDETPRPSSSMGTDTAAIVGGVVGGVGGVLVIAAAIFCVCRCSKTSSREDAFDPQPSSNVMPYQHGEVQPMASKPVVGRVLETFNTDGYRLPIPAERPQQRLGYNEPYPSALPDDIEALPDE